MYRSLEEAIAWLTNAFGFVEHYRHGNPLSGAQMKAGNAWIMLKQLKPEGRTPGELGFGTQSLTVFIDDLEAHFAKAQSAGVALEENLHETVYGELQYAARDLDGHHWLFSRHARDLSPDEWGAIVAGATGSVTGGAKGTMNAHKRPIPVLAIACLYMIVGSFGFVRNLRGIWRPDLVWIELTEVLAVIAGVFMLRRRNWARWLALGWMAFHVALTLITPHSLVVHSLIFVLIAWALLRSEAREYFHSR